MSQPTKASVHVDAPLTNISIAYMNSRESYVATRVFPIVPVDKQSDKYFTFDKAAFFRDQAQKRGEAQESAGSGYNLSSDTYYCDVWALHKDIGDQTRANTDNPLNADRNAAQFVTEALLIRREKEFVDTAFTTGVWATSVTPSSQWSDLANSDPLGDIETAKTAILQSTGREANTLVLGYEVFTKLKNHTDLKEMVKYTSSRVITEELLASLLGVQRVLVPKVVIDSAADGASGVSMSFAYGKHALLCHVPAAAGIEIPSAGYTFAWRGLDGSFGDAGLRMKKFRMEHLEADRVEGELAIDVKVTGSDLGFFWSSAVA
jgi:hypothetical protein